MLEKTKEPDSIRRISGAEIYCLILATMGMFGLIFVIWYGLFKIPSSYQQLVIPDFSEVEKQLLAAYSNLDRELFMHVLSDMASRGQVITTTEFSSNLASFYNSLIAIVLGAFVILNLVSYVIIRGIDRKVIIDELWIALNDMFTRDLKIQELIKKEIDKSVNDRLDDDLGPTLEDRLRLLVEDAVSKEMLKYKKKLADQNINTESEAEIVSEPIDQVNIEDVDEEI